MATKGSASFGASVKVDGEKEFKQALENINNGLRVNSSELQKLTAQYASSGSSVEALTRKQEALESKIAGQQEKVETLRKALSAAATDYGESDKRTMAWQVSLNKAEAELFKLNDELSNNQKALEESKTTTDGMKYSNDQLTKSIADQQTKISELKKGLAENASQYGENDQRTLYFKDALNKAQTELDGMNKELSNNEKALKSAEEKTSSLGDKVRGLADIVGIEIPPALNGMINKLDGVSASGGALVGVLAGITTALYKTTIATSQTADDILTLSSTSGIATDTLQELNYASELLDVSVDTINGSITKMIRSMESSKTKTSEQAKAFKELHVSTSNSNGSLKDANAVFLKTLDALGKVKNETDRDALSMQIFGKSARDLNPLIEAGSGKLRELSQEAHNVGYVMSEDTLESFGQLDDAIQRMNKQSDALKNSFAVALLPMLTALAEAFAKIPVPVLQTTIVLAGIITTIVLAVKAIKEVTETGSAITKFFKTADGDMDMTKIKILAVVAALVALAAIIAVIMGKSGEIERTFSSIGNSVGKINGQVNNASTSGAYNRIPAYAKGTTYHPGGNAIVGENGPEIVSLPRGSRVYPNGVYPQGGGDTYNITIEARTIQEFNDVYRIVKNQRRWGVQGVTQ
nr:MAG TPA: tail tape measure [Caudoviricetes sp.]